MITRRSYRLILWLGLASTGCGGPEMSAQPTLYSELPTAERAMSERVSALRELEVDYGLEIMESSNGELRAGEGRTEVLQLPPNRCVAVFVTGASSLVDIDIRAFDSLGRSLGGDRRSEPSQYAAYVLCAGSSTRQLVLRTEAAQGEGEFRAARVQFGVGARDVVADALDAVVGPSQFARSERANRWGERLRDRGYEVGSGSQITIRDGQARRVPIRLEGPGCHTFGLFVDAVWSRSGVVLQDEWGRRVVSADYEGNDAFMQACSRRAAHWTLSVPDDVDIQSVDLWSLQADPMRSAGRRGLWWGVRAPDEEVHSSDDDIEPWRASLARNGVGPAILEWSVSSEPHQIEYLEVPRIDDECVVVVGAGAERGRGLTLVLLPGGGAAHQQRVVSETSRVVGISCGVESIEALHLQLSTRGPRMQYSLSVHRVEARLRDRLLRLGSPQALRYVAEAMAEGWVLIEVLGESESIEAHGSARENPSHSPCERWVRFAEPSREGVIQPAAPYEVTDWVSCDPHPRERPSQRDESASPSGVRLHFVTMPEAA